MALQKQPKAYTQNGRRFAYTPGNDFALNVVLLYGAGLLSSAPFQGTPTEYPKQVRLGENKY